jgi:hypothetical protein
MRSAEMSLRFQLALAWLCVFISNGQLAVVHWHTSPGGAYLHALLSGLAIFLMLSHGAQFLNERRSG